MPLDGIANVDVRLTGPEVKAKVMERAMSNWSKVTCDYPFDSRSFTLRLAKTNVDLVRDFPDTPALYGQCIATTGKSKGRFQYGKSVKVILVLDSAEYEVIDEHIKIQKALVGGVFRILCHITTYYISRPMKKRSLLCCR